MAPVPVFLSEIYKNRREQRIDQGTGLCHARRDMDLSPGFWNQRLSVAAAPYTKAKENNHLFLSESIDK